MKYLKVEYAGIVRHYTSIRVGARNKTYPGLTIAYETKETATGRKDDLVQFISMEKTAVGGTYTDDSG